MGIVVKYSIFAILLLAFFVGLTAGQNKPPWTEFSKKDAEKILNESPWSQTQVDTDTSEMVYSPTAANRMSADRKESGAKNQALSVSYHIRFLSARPIRQALGRMIILAQQNPNADLVDQLQSFIERDFSAYIVIAVTFEGADGRLSGPAMQAFAAATGNIIKNNTYLERKDGKRLYLMDYHPPGIDGLGAKFIFPGAVDGGPFLSQDMGNVRFYSDINAKVKLNVTYKISEMLYDGKFEY